KLLDDGRQFHFSERKLLRRTDDVTTKIAPLEFLLQGVNDLLPHGQGGQLFAFGESIDFDGYRLSSCGLEPVVKVFSRGNRNIMPSYLKGASSCGVQMSYQTRDGVLFELVFHSSILMHR